VKPSSPIEVPRPDLVATLADRVRSGPPLLLTGPPGAGKTTLLLHVAERLRQDGWLPVYLDLMGAASSPESFVRCALGALPAEAFGRELPRATEIRRLADSGRSYADQAVQGLFALWSALDETAGRPVLLILDEVTEARSLAYFSGLREVERLLGTALARRRRGTLVATSLPTLARRVSAFETAAAPPITAAELAPFLPPGTDPAAVASASFGWARHARVLLERIAGGEDVADAWAAEMALGGRLELGCRHTYETLLLRSRGYGISKAVLAAVAREEGLNLTALVARLGRTPGAIRDYLQWLVGVDALTVVKKRYFYVDGLVRWWVRLHARGVPASAREIEDAAREAAAPRREGGEPTAQAGDTAIGTATPALVEAGPAGILSDVQSPSLLGRRDSLMEID
jgi:hypothetical protein